MQIKLEKQKKKKKKTLKVITKSLVVAFFFSSFFISLYLILFGNITTTYVTFLNNISIEEILPSNDDVKVDKETHTITNYPGRNTKYGTLEIKNVDIKLPIYLGDSYKNLSKGIGHYAGSMFPGEGGAIVMAGHNNKGFLYNLYDVEKDNIINIDTIYGKFKYKVYKTDIIKDTESEKLPLVTEEETLMLYTCYPHTLGRTNKRFVVYAHLVEAKYE